MVKKGDKLPDYWKKAISDAHKTGNYGGQGQRLVRYWKKHKMTGKNNPFFGKHHTKEAREKLSVANSGKNSPWYGRKMTRAEVKKRLHRREMSGVETRVFSIIKKYHLPYRFVGNGDFFVENKNPDFVNVNGKKVAVEVYWKDHKDLFRGGTDKWKRNRRRIFKRYGWSIIFIEASRLNETIILNALEDKNKWHHQTRPASTATFMTSQVSIT